MSDAIARPLRVSLIQQSGLDPEPDVNKTELCRVIDQLAVNSDFVMPTELATTIYFAVVRDRSLTRWAETLDGAFVSQIREIAAHRRCAVLLPVYLQEAGGTYANSVIVIGTDGNIVRGHARHHEPLDFYSKVHLPSARRGDEGIDETYYFARGTSFPVFQVDETCIGILTCYDRRFPEAWRSLALSGAELIFMPSCVPLWNPSASASTGDLFVAELQTRACENGVFVAACNRAGGQSIGGTTTRFLGLSCIIDPAGGILKQGSAADADTVSAAIDLDKVRRVRRRLPMLDDRQMSAYDLEPRR